MTAVLGGLSRPRGRRRRPRRWGARSWIRTLGEVLITLGILVLLYVVYQLYWTGLETDRAQDSLREQLSQDWQSAAPALGNAADPATAAAVPPSLPLGDGFAVMRAPRLGQDWQWVVVEGVRERDLAQGPGHYPDTARPGEVGNVSIAGHRMTNGAPFTNLDLLVAGDAIVLETADRWYTYRVDRPGEIVEPTRVDVVLPVPGEPDAVPTEKRLTLTTCHPRWSSRYRMVVSAVLESEQPKSAGVPAALTGGVT